MSTVVVARELEDAEQEGCPECDARLDHSPAEIVCSDCGLVVEADRIDHGPEWSRWNAEERKRTGHVRVDGLHDGGLSTEIGRYRDGAGRKLSAEKRHRLARQRMLHRRARFRSKKERLQAHGLGEIHRMAAALDVDDSTQRQACRLFKSAHDAGLLVGRTIEGFATAAIVASARVNHRALAIDDAVGVSRVDERTVMNGLRSLSSELGLPLPPPRAEEQVPRIVDELGLPEDARRRATELARLADESAGHSKSPSGVAAAAIWLATGCGGPPQRRIGEVAGCTNVTIRNNARMLEKMQDESEATGGRSR